MTRKLWIRVSVGAVLLMAWLLTVVAVVGVVGVVGVV